MWTWVDLRVDEGHVVLVPPHEGAAVAPQRQYLGHDISLAHVGEVAVLAGLLGSLTRPQRRHPRLVLL